MARCSINSCSAVEAARDPRRSVGDPWPFVPDPRSSKWLARWAYCARSVSISGRWSGQSADRASMRSRAACVATSRAEASSCSSAPSPCTRRTRNTQGNVSPCPTRVTRITQIVRKMSRSRSWNGAPEAVVKGSARAAASETTPRMPAQESTTSSRQAVRVSARERRGWASQSVTNIQTKRTTTTLPQTSSATPTSPSSGLPARRITIVGNCRPIKINTRPSSRNTSVSHTARPCTRVSASINDGA